MKRKKPLKRTPLKRKPRRNGDLDAVGSWCKGRLRYCWNCLALEFPGNKIEVHHILNGKYGRPDIPENLSFLCGGFKGICHRLAEGECIRNSDGDPYINLSLANILYLKQKHDPQNYKPEVLQARMGNRILPEPEEPK